MKNMKKSICTPSQTVGPFYSNFLKFNFKNPKSIDENKKIKNSAVLICNIRDKNENIIKDSFIEYWQIDDIYKKYNLLNFNRVKYDKEHKSIIVKFYQYQFSTYLNIVVFAKGLLNHLHTVVFLEDEKNFQNEALFKNLPKKRRNSLIASLIDIKNSVKYYEFNLYLSGNKETIFFKNLPSKYYAKQKKL